MSNTYETFNIQWNGKKSFWKGWNWLFTCWSLFIVHLILNLSKMFLVKCILLNKIYVINFTFEYFVTDYSKSKAICSNIIKKGFWRNSSSFFPDEKNV